MASRSLEVDESESAAESPFLEGSGLRAEGRGRGGQWRLAGGAALLLAAAAGAVCYTSVASNSRSPLPHRGGPQDGEVEELFAATSRGKKLAVFDMTHWHCISKCPEGHCCTEEDCAWACRDSPLCATTSWESASFQCVLFGHPSVVERNQDTSPPAASPATTPAATTPRTTPAAPPPQITTPSPSEANGECAAAGKDCRASACCSEQGNQCFEKDTTWASCKAECNPASGWGCKAIGPRTPRKLSCSWAGEDCSQTALCCNRNLNCIRKDVQSAYCTTQAGPDWDGAKLGGARTEIAVKPASGGAPHAGSGLFCFAAVLPGSPEEQLVAAARQRKAGIFGCDASAVYDSEHCDFVHQGTWKSVVNTDVFIKVWERVRDDGTYKQFDWTVKADPDTVFFADRLQSHLQNLHAPADEPIYVKNCGLQFGFMGAIEVVSTHALLKFFDNYKDCRRTMGAFSGEDGFVKDCLDMCGVGFMTDTALLRNPFDETPCSDGSQVAFHPRKSVDQWISCFNVATR